MSRYETTLGTIRCRTSKATVDALVSRFGLRASEARERDHFDILSGGRANEPEVDSDLFDLALGTLRSAERDGALPPWSIVASNTGQHLA
jgi:hypothetical protein